MTQLIQGIYYYPASSKAESAELQVTGKNISLHYQQQCILNVHISDVKIGDLIPGVACEVNFGDGGKFVADDASVRIAASSSTLERLEKNKPLILAAIFLVPLLMWFNLTVVMPKIADSTVPFLPDSVSENMGEQVFSIIKKTMLEPSELPLEQQDKVKQQWSDAVSQLGLSTEKFKLHVFASDFFGANAFALPDGTVVITDDLLTRLDDKPDAIVAILLHEIGHVEHQHSLRMVAQSVSTAVVLAVIFGDIEGIGEVLLGTGSTLLQNAFSRDMEREADDYALNHLVVLGLKPAAFAEAMESFLDIKEKQNEESSGGKFLKYLSTHPDTKERIKHAKEFEK
ncbi:MAG: M48 family metallopeptidase [Psychrobium sp.]|nr:M48 family metallopeptidase [Psychrobium sp.]